MAGYKARKIRLDPLKIAIFTFLGLLLFFIVIVFIFSLGDWDDYILDLSDNETYFVYAYTETCSECQEIRDDVADFTASNAMDIELIPVNVALPTVPAPNDMLVPRIYVIYNSEIVSMHTGIDDVRALFTSVEQGVFQP